MIETRIILPAQLKSTRPTIYTPCFEQHHSLIENLYVRRGGEPRRIRTPDPLIQSQVLYPAELSVQKANK